MYFGSEDSNLYYGHPGDPLEKMEVIDIAPLNSVMDLRVIDEKLWICARNGIGVMDEDGVHVLEDVPMNNSVGHVIVDYEGNLWFTSTRQGVMKIVRSLPTVSSICSHGINCRMRWSTPPVWPGTICSSVPISD